MYSNNQIVEQGQASGAIPAFTIVAKGTTSDGTCVPAITTGTQKLWGVSPNYSVASGAMLPITTGGIAQITAGGSIVNGDILTNDTNGYAITATNFSSNKYNTIGVANRSASTGDIIPMLVRPMNFAY
jgi:hypothetical protein